MHTYKSFIRNTFLNKWIRVKINGIFFSQNKKGNNGFLMQNGYVY